MLWVAEQRLLEPLRRIPVRRIPANPSLSPSFPGHGWMPAEQMHWVLDPHETFDQTNRRAKAHVWVYS